MTEFHSFLLTIGILGPIAAFAVVANNYKHKWKRQGMAEGWDPESPLHSSKFKRTVGKHPALSAPYRDGGVIVPRATGDAYHDMILPGERIEFGKRDKYQPGDEVGGYGRPIAPGGLLSDAAMARFVKDK